MDRKRANNGMYWLMCKGFNVDEDELDIYHAKFVREVKRINGVIEFPKIKRRNDYEEYKPYRKTMGEKSEF